MLPNPKSSPGISRIGTIGLLVALFLLAFVLRAYRPATRTDKKLNRARVFTSELLRGHWAGTYQTIYPGVPMMAASGLTVRLYYALADTPARLLFDWAVPPYVTDFGQRMVVGVYGLSVVLSGLVVAIALALRKLAGWTLALTAAGLLIFSPYYLTQSRVVHVDALMSTFMLLSVLLLLISQETGKRRYLMLSGFVGGLAVLTKSPSVFLVPFTGLTLLAYLVTDVRSGWSTHTQGRVRWLLGEIWRGLIAPGLVWGLMLALPFLFWPAMWVKPIVVLRKVFGGLFSTGTKPHPHPVFLAGHVYVKDRPGVLFYPLTIAFKSTFVTLTLGLLALGHYTLWHRRVRPPLRPLQFWLLVVYAFFFVVQMSLGSKLFAQYVLPTHLALELMAAVGLVGFASLIKRVVVERGFHSARRAPALLMGLAVGLQASVALIFAPDYGAHHNYLLGGNRVAVNVVQVAERNEGMLDVAEYLYSQGDLESRRLATVFPLVESIIQYFPGEIKYGMSNEADYYLFGRATMQRQLAPQFWEEAWETFRYQTPRMVVRFDGVEYLWLYEPEAADAGQPIVVERGWSGFIGLAWLWTLALLATLVWSLRRTPGTEPGWPAGAERP